MKRVVWAGPWALVLALGCRNPEPSVMMAPQARFGIYHTVVLDHRPEQATAFPGLHQVNPASYERAVIDAMVGRGYREGSKPGQDLWVRVRALVSGGPVASSGSGSGPAAVPFRDRGRSGGGSEPAPVASKSGGAQQNLILRVELRESAGTESVWIGSVDLGVNYGDPTVVTAALAELMKQLPPPNP
jgi:hypothetical protein